jgi:hypothetical protein
MKKTKIIKRPLRLFTDNKGKKYLMIKGKRMYIKTQLDGDKLVQVIVNNTFSEKSRRTNRKPKIVNKRALDNTIEGVNNTQAVMLSRILNNNPKDSFANSVLLSGQLNSINNGLNKLKSAQKSNLNNAGVPSDNNLKPEFNKNENNTKQKADKNSTKEKANENNTKEKENENKTKQKENENNMKQKVDEEQLRRIIEASKKEFAEQKAANEKEVNNLKKNMSDMKMNISDTINELKDEKLKLYKLNANYADLEKTTKSQDQLLKKQENSIKDLEDKKNKLESSFKKTSEEHKAAINFNKVIENKILEVNKELEDKLKEIEIRKKELSEKDIDLKKANTISNESELKVNNLQRTMNDIKIKLIDTTTELKDEKLKLNKLNDKYADLEKTTKSQDQLLKKQEDSVKYLEDIKNKLETSFKKISEEHIEANKELETKLKEIEKMKHELSLKDSDLNRANTIANESESMIKKYNIKIQKKDDELEQMDKDLDFLIDWNFKEFSLTTDKKKKLAGILGLTEQQIKTGKNKINFMRPYEIIDTSLISKKKKREIKRYLIGVKNKIGSYFNESDIDFNPIARIVSRNDDDIFDNEPEEIIKEEENNTNNDLPPLEEEKKEEKKTVFKSLLPGENNLIVTEEEDKGYGNNNSLSGLYDTQINEIMKEFFKIGYKGTVPIDKISMIKIKPDEMKDRISFIMNTGTSKSKGKHWIAVVFDFQDRSLLYYDSLAEQPSKMFLYQIKQLIDKMKLPYYLKIKINKIQRQSNVSDSCGWFAMKFIMDIYNEKEYKFCTGYMDIKKGEKSIRSLKKKFGYI